MGPKMLRKKVRRKISWTDGQTDRGKTVYPPPPSGSGGIIKTKRDNKINIYNLTVAMYTVETHIKVRGIYQAIQDHFYLSLN